MLIRVSADNSLEFENRRYRCALGRSGIRADKREGDGATPAGRYALKRLYLRRDRIPTVTTRLPITDIAPNDGWCDDPVRDEYNTPVKLPFDGSHEAMWREDHLYDLVIEIAHNDAPPVPGLGSAVFIHVAKPDYTPTEGCVALARGELLSLLASWGPETEIEVYGGVR